MSGLAEILHDRGFTVSGSDMKASPLTEHLKSLGIQVSVPQSPDNVKSGIELCIYTAAIAEGNPELQEVKRQGIPTMSRAELLGRIMKNYKEAINVSGTHGKTTTTSMIGEILLEAQMDPTITVGGMMKDIGGNLRVGNPSIFWKIFPEEKLSLSDTIMRIIPQTSFLMITLPIPRIPFLKEERIGDKLLLE